MCYKSERTNYAIMQGKRSRSCRTEDVRAQNNFITTSDSSVFELKVNTDQINKQFLIMCFCCQDY
jgi:hypothetical protein